MQNGAVYFGAPQNLNSNPPPPKKICFFIFRGARGTRREAWPCGTKPHGRREARLWQQPFCERRGAANLPRPLGLPYKWNIDLRSEGNWSAS